MGIENQDRVHYGMPVRIMLEDAAGYDRQLRQIRRGHRARRDLRGDEFISGFAKHDKVHPVVTLCIYYGKTPYNGARELYQMMDYENLPRRLKWTFNNRHIGKEETVTRVMEKFSVSSEDAKEYTNQYWKHQVTQR